MYEPLKLKRRVAVQRQATSAKQHQAQPEAESLPASSGQLPMQSHNQPNSGLPDTLKLGIERLSGFSMADVRVHYNSPQPAQLNAHAFAHGADIHLAPRQEQHLPHEAWHVVQQKQGRVKPRVQFKGRVPLNDDVALEREADVMGDKALRSSVTAQSGSTPRLTVINQPVVQGVGLFKKKKKNKEKDALEQFKDELMQEKARAEIEAGLMQHTKFRLLQLRTGVTDKFMQQMIEKILHNYSIADYLGYVDEIGDNIYNAFFSERDTMAMAMSKRQMRQLLHEDLTQAQYSGTIVGFTRRASLDKTLDDAAHWIYGSSSTYQSNEVNAGFELILDGPNKVDKTGEKSRAFKAESLADIRLIIQDYIINKAELTHWPTISFLHARLTGNSLVNDIRKAQKPDESGKAYGSSLSGAAYLSQHLEYLKQQNVGTQLAKYLLASILRFHPFSDGNGRTARLVYAIQSIRDGVFRPLSSQSENNLHKMNSGQVLVADRMAKINAIRKRLQVSGTESFSALITPQIVHDFTQSYSNRYDVESDIIAGLLLTQQSDLKEIYDKLDAKKFFTEEEILDFLQRFRVRQDSNLYRKLAAVMP